MILVHLTLIHSLTTSVCHFFSTVSSSTAVSVRLTARALLTEVVIAVWPSINVARATLVDEGTLSASRLPSQNRSTNAWLLP